MSTSSTDKLESIALKFGVPVGLLRAVERAEGNILKAVQCSIPTISTREAALEVTARSAAHALFDFTLAGGGDAHAFVAFWARRWAPVGAANDPGGLNSNWAKNVSALWLNAKAS